MNMKLAIDPETVRCDEIDAIASDALVEEISALLNLHPDKMGALKSSLVKMYREFMDGHYDVRNSLPEHEESKALLKVFDDAYTLLKTLNGLMELGHTDKRLASRLDEFHNKQIEMHNAIGDKKYFHDERNPNYNLRRMIGHICASAKMAADEPPIDHFNFDPSVKGKADPKDIDRYKQRVQERKTPKDLPIRNSAKILEVFFKENTNIPFTAGKYHPDNGFVTHAFIAVKTVLKKIYPQVSDRKIASIMQEISSK